ncbi:hypothetical protein TWF694_006521 [Orbilia ellipsospora]|uniref:Uncharacterized protein n=1 Tax=Orbilia ellipsospora TaxID=2528407 RepID=A0AAV9XKG8_9PEZI
MRASVFVLATAISYVSAQTSITATPGSLPLGAQCDSTDQCANGAQCYGVSSMTIKTCGSFQSACTSDSQCATNTCNQGFCNGMLSSSGSSSVAATTTASNPAETSIVAAPGSLPVGAQCSSDEQCANGAQCYGVSSFTIRTCGSFQSVCTSDSQCATNTCNQGFCNGMLLSSSGSATTGSPSTTATGIYTAPSTSVSAVPSSLPLGAQCSSDEQCAGGAQCYGVTAMTIRTCGSFQSACTSNAQCATNLCNQGFCNGPLPSGSMTTSYTPTTTSTGGGSGGNVTVTTGGPSGTATSSIVPTGAASRLNVGVAGLVGAVLFAVVF